jgi:hypothetical protein
VFRDGVLILPTLKNTPGANSSLIEAPCDIMPAMPGDAPGDKGYYYDRRQKRLFVNLGGRVPGKDAEVRAAHPDKEIAALEVKGANEGIPGLIALSAGRAK